MNGSHSKLPTITLVHNSEKEQQTREQLIRLLQTYALDKWLFTTDIQIEHMVIPHSHPILTLNTRLLGENLLLLATYLHEQLHWFVLLEERIEGLIQAKDTFRTIYQNFPVEDPAWGGSEESFYLHLVVCYLEDYSLIEILGKEQAQNVMEGRGHYKKIYELIARDRESIGAIVAQYGLIP